MILALAFVLKTHTTLAEKDGISIILTANVSVRPNIVPLMKTWTQDFVVPSHGTAFAQLVFTPTPSLVSVNALNNFVQWV